MGDIPGTTSYHHVRRDEDFFRIPPWFHLLSVENCVKQGLSPALAVTYDSALVSRCVPERTYYAPCCASVPKWASRGVTGAVTRGLFATHVWLVT